MAIYRTGKASLDANGIVTGYGTKWRKSLSLIRVGATIIFIDTPAYATIIDVVSDTELRVTDTAGAVVPESNYIILLHDSLSVDGLAQDVAETLRYYQGKENEFAHLIELINAMDIEAVQKVVDQMKEEVKKFEENFKQIEAKAAEVARNAEEVAINKEAIELIHTQTEDLKNQAHSSALQAQSHVNAAAAEVEKAAAEFHKAEQEAARAGEEAVKAKAEATRAEQVVADAKADVVAAAQEEVKRASAEADRAQGVVDAAKEEVKVEAQVFVDNASKEADRAKTEADRAAQLADQMDTTKVMLKSNNLSDVENKEEARRNLGVDNIVHDELETKIMTSSKQIWLSLRNKDGSPWGVYDNSHKMWVALKPEQGGTGATTLDGARINLKVDRLKQDVNMTRLFANDGKTELRIGQTEWYVYRTSNDSEHGYVPLGVDGGGTGGTTPEEARRGIGLERFVQESDRTRIVTADGGKSFAITNGGAWGVYTNDGGWIPLTIASGGTGANTEDGARRNLKLDRFVQQEESQTYVYSQNMRYKLFIDNSGDWGAFDETSGVIMPLPVSRGGTGATDSGGALNNLGLGYWHSPRFNNMTLANNEDVPNSGVLSLTRVNATTNAVVTQGRVYHEVQGGIGKITFHVNSNNKNRYVQIDEDGRMTGLERIDLTHLQSGGISSSGWISANQGGRVGLTTNEGGNKDVYLQNIGGDSSPGGWVNLVQGNWYSGYWQIGGVRGSSTDIDHFKIGVNNQGGDWKDFRFHNSYGGHIVSPKGFKGKCDAGAWGKEWDYMGAPFHAESVSGNEAGWSPIVSGGSLSAGGYHLRIGLGVLGQGSSTWPATALKLCGDGKFHRAFNFTVDGSINTWDQGFGGGGYDFAKNPTSDRDLKDNIEYNDGSESYNRVMQWKPATFNYKGQSVKRYGLIAQDMMKVDDQYVRLVPGAPVFEDVIGVNEDGEEYVDHQIETDRKDDTLALDSNVMLADMACAMRYMGEQMEEMKREIERLKAELASK